MSTPHTTKISTSKGIPGTVGCLAYLRHNGEPVLVSNWHVLYGKGAVKNDKVWLVENHGVDQKYSLTEVGRVVSGKIGLTWFHNWEVFVDCAICTYTIGSNLSSLFNTTKKLSVPTIAGHAEARVGERVYKVGAGTGITKGIVVENRHSDTACIEGNTLFVKGQLLIRSEDGSPFSGNNDSGAAIINKDNKIVGLLWGTNCWGEGLACPIEPVMSVLNIEFNPIRQGIYFL
jgi:hypothetical protein